MTNQTTFPFETTKARFLFVVVPDDAKDIQTAEGWIEINGIKDDLYFGYYLNSEPVSFQLPPGDWQLLGTGDLNEVTEEQAVGVVDEKIIGSNRLVYNHYLKGHYWTILAIESLQSLARSLGIPEDKKTIVLFTLK